MNDPTDVEQPVLQPATSAPKAAARIRGRLEQLRDRFVAVSLRSRSLRLRRTTRTGAFDLARLADEQPATLDALRGVLGNEDAAPTRLAPDSDALDADIGRVARAAREEHMETGADNLAVGWPILEGACADGTWLRAPLLLYPVKLERTDTGRLCWALTPRGLPEVNEPLIQAFVRLEGLRLSRDDLLAFDDDGLLAVDDPTWRALVDYLRDAGLAVDAAEGLPALSELPARDAEASAAATAGQFELHHHLVLGRFPLSASSIVLDYDELLSLPDEHLLGDDLGLALDLLRVDESTLDDIETHELDDQPTSEHPASDQPPLGQHSPLGELRRWQVLASDASQDAVFRYLEAVASSPAAERGVVVQGPPGTGKSQLIANLLAACVGRGQRVLLVCQKRAALDVVADRLSALGMAEPVALVHDVQRDRNDICAAIAGTLERGISGGELDTAGLERQIEAAGADHYRALNRLESRAGAAQQAYRRLSGADDPRPGLAELLERALDDDGRELPDLRAYAADIARGDLDAHLPFVESVAPETYPLAWPHPLARRGDFGGLDADALDALFARLEALDALFAELERPAAQMTPGEARRRDELWRDAAPLLDLLDSEDTDDVESFALFWVWTDGQVATGEWNRVMRTLEAARERLAPVPYELVMARRKTLETWEAQLARLAELRTHWYRFALPEFWRLRKVPGHILDHCNSLVSSSGSAGVPVDVAALVDQALAWSDFIGELPTDNPLFEFGFDGDPRTIDDAIETLKTQHRRVRCAHELHRALAQVGAAYAELPQLDPLLEQAPGEAPFFAAALADRHRAQALAAIDDALDSLVRAIASAFRRELLDLASVGDIASARAQLAAFLQARSDADEAARQDAVSATKPAWLRAFLRRWKPGAGGVARVSDDVRTAVERAWIDCWLDGQSVRAVEAPLVAAEQRQRLADALGRCHEVAGRGIVAQFYGRLVRSFAASSSPADHRRAMRKLAADARRKRSRKTLRQLIDAYWDQGLAQVRPAWCCSPESVAAMFPLRAGLFDVVIFDEASQCPVESALPALLRAQTAVIAGDDQQMPPSHFFRASPDVSDDEDSSLLASVSILSLARACYPGVTLQWHYRSHHEELVALSNAAFYGGQLVTAPSSEPYISTDIEGLHWEPVDGVWEENRNRVEAGRVVELIGDFLAVVGPDGHPPTVGVVTFNRKQSELVELLVEQRAARDAHFAELLARDRRRPVVDQLFVRNLENVQGNERDLIIMSPGYGPSEPGGPVHARFGPLNLDGGHKRLNVAITRARLGLWLVTSIVPERLDVSNTTHPGPRVFDAYLRFVRAHSTGDVDGVHEILAQVRGLGLAGRSSGPAPSATSGGFDLGGAATGSRVLDELARALERRGCQVRRDVGLGSQRLDLAVRRRDDQPWQLGVDCRGFLRQPEPLSRDVYLPAFWQRQGWTITRVSPGMWRERADEVIDELLALTER